MIVRTGGTLQEIPARQWATLCASFLGAGFRIDLPQGPDRSAAASHELARVRRLADLLGLEVTDEDWHAAARDHGDVDVELIGGWPRAYSSTPQMWVAAIPVEPATIATTMLISLPVATSPTRGLPTLSRLADEVALRSIHADCGLWADRTGAVVSSTAGPVIAQRSDGRWVTGVETGTWLASRMSIEHRARPELTVDDLEAAPFLGLIHRAIGVLPLTYVAADPAT